MPRYVAQALFIGSAEDEAAFREIVLAALDGDVDARERLRASTLNVIAIDPEPNDG
jgi:hypothetical protein